MALGRFLDLARNVLRFIASNILGTVVDLGLMMILSAYVFHSYVGDYILTPFISFEGSVICNYLTSYFFVWKDRVRGRDLKFFMQTGFVYAASMTGTFVVRLGLILVLELIFGWSVVYCNIVAMCFTGLMNFALGEWVIFRKKL